MFFFVKVKLFFWPVIQNHMGFTMFFGGIHHFVYPGSHCQQRGFSHPQGFLSTEPPVNFHEAQRYGGGKITALHWERPGEWIQLEDHPRTCK